MFKPTEVKPLADHRLWIRFSDGTHGEVDLSHLSGKGVFSSWTDEREFAKVYIAADGTIAWSDEVELCPDALYMKISGRKPEEIFPNLRGAEVDA